MPLVVSCRFTAFPGGTHYWHSHSGFQRADGLYGAIIVHDPEDPWLHLYDYDLPEHIIQIQDWMLMLTQSMFTGHYHSNGLVWDRASKSMLFNGIAFIQKKNCDWKFSLFIVPCTTMDPVKGRL